MINLPGSTLPPPPKKRELELAERVMLAAFPGQPLIYLSHFLCLEMAKVREILAAEKPVGEVVFEGWANVYDNSKVSLHYSKDSAASLLDTGKGRTIRVRVHAVPEVTP